MALPTDIWGVILNKIKEDDSELEDSTIRLAFLSSVSKQFSSLCKAFKQQNKDENQPKPTGFMLYFAFHGYLSCLVYAHENGCQWHKSTCSVAAMNGHLECLKYAHENGCEWDKDTCVFAIRSGSLECLKYACENGCNCRWHEVLCNLAAHKGQLSCLQYAHENGCPWNNETCYGAAEACSLDCLKYARENGCEWDEWTCYGAAFCTLPNYIWSAIKERPIQEQTKTICRK